MNVGIAVGRGLRTSLLDFGDNLMTFSFFTFMVHFQWDSNCVLHVNCQKAA